MTPKKCGYCRKTFTPRDDRHRYCKPECGAKARFNQKERYKPRTNLPPAHVVRALDAFEATYGTRIPAERPEGLGAWCQLLQEAA